MKLQEFKKNIDPLIINFLNDQTKPLYKDECLQFLIKQFEYIEKYIDQGKRIRPYMAYATYLSNGGQKNKSIIKNLLFIEIFHYFCLIHDDIMDKSQLRHGIKTLNSKFSNSEAILLGDYLFSWSWKLLLSIEVENNKKQQIISTFNNMIDDVFLGQALDLNITKRKKVNEDLIHKKTLHKTAGYTFAKPMTIGLIFADKYTNKNIKKLEELGENIGLAFQIQDDLLDITSDFKGTKTPLNDVREGNHTIFTNFVFQNGSRDQIKILKSNFGKDKINIKKVREVFYKTGAIEYGKKQIKYYIEKSKKIAGNDKYYMDIIQQIEKRQK